MVSEFFNLFGCLDRAHGEFVLSDSSEGTKKKGRAQTILTPVTEDLWDKHLSGSLGLGCIPIRDDATAGFGAVDIDLYNLDLEKLDEIIQKEKIPVIVCRTKSGGAHLYMFLHGGVPASLVREKLTAISHALGFSGCEIFPKQVKLASDKDVGNWINMPYFAGDSTDRYAIRGGEKLSTSEFITEAKKIKLTETDLEKYFPPESDEPFGDGPPCIQKLVQNGFPEGTRNNGLFSLGVYARKKFGDDWEDRVDQLNHKYMDPPLSHKEVSTVVRSLNKKSYGYKCQDEPFCGYCNKQVCRNRKFGVGNDDEAVPYVLGTLVKLNTDPPTWFIDVDGHRVELTTDDLIQQDRFRKLCVEKIHKFPKKVKNPTWEKMVANRLEQLEIIEAPRDAGDKGQFLSHLEAFCTLRPGKVMDDLLRGKIFISDSRVYFRSGDLVAYLDRVRFKVYKPREIWAILRQEGATHHQQSLKGKCVQCWSVPEPEKQKEDFDAPKENTIF